MTVVVRTTILSALIWFALSPAAIAETCALPSELEHGRPVSLHVINVGKADAMAVTCRDGRIGMMVDTGDNRDVEGMKRMTGYLKTLASKSPDGPRIGLLVVTHPDADHIGGAGWVLENFNVGIYLDNGKPSGRKNYLNVRAEVKKLAAERRLEYLHADGERRSFDICPDVRAEIVTPRPYFADCKTTNECSVVIKVSTGSVSFLLTGDAGKAQERELLKSYKGREVLGSDVLKVGHHGSSSSTTQQFLDAVTPSCSVISSGRAGEGANRQYNHPRKAVVKRLMEADRMERRDRTAIDAYDPKKGAFVKITHSSCLYSTASDGSVIFSTDGKRLACEAGK